MNYLTDNRVIYLSQYFESAIFNMKNNCPGEMEIVDAGR